MQTNQIVRLCMLVALVSAPFYLLLAQTGTAPKDTITSNCAEAWGDMVGNSTGAPVTATWKRTYGAKQADGKTFTEGPVEKIVRDSSGRMYFETLVLPVGNETKPQSSFWVVDPVKHISFWWQTGSNVLSLHHDDDPNTPENRERQLKVPWLKALWAEPLCVAWGPEGQYLEGQYTQDKLGTKTILGVAAEGILASRILPSGYKGYDHAVTVTQERWYSDVLQLTLIDIGDDPRIGRATWQVVSLERAEPSPAFFELPKGYVVREVKP